MPGSSPGTGEDPVTEILRMASHWRGCASVAWELTRGTDATLLRRLTEAMGGRADAGLTLGHPLAVSRRNRRIADRQMDWHLRLGHHLHRDDPMPECRQLAIAEVGEPEPEDRRPHYMAARHKALGSLASGITYYINKLVVVDAHPVLSGDDVGVRPWLVARGPLASGYLLILEIDLHVHRR